jgi:hypothetical protein
MRHYYREHDDTTPRDLRQASTQAYQGMGLSNEHFIPASDTRIEAQLEAALGQSEFVAIYGQMFDDGGDNGKGIHETHRNPDKADQDGAVVVYIAAQPGQPLVRRWFFFMFHGETVS